MNSISTTMLLKNMTDGCAKKIDYNKRKYYSRIEISNRQALGDLGVMQCPTCYTVLPSMKILEFHFRQLHGNESGVRCNMCDYKRVFTFKEFVVHINEYHGGVNLRGKGIRRTVYKPKEKLESDDLLRHFRLQYCLACDKIMSTNDDVDRHFDSEFDTSSCMVVSLNADQWSKEGFSFTQTQESAAERRKALFRRPREEEYEYGTQPGSQFVNYPLSVETDYPASVDHQNPADTYAESEPLLPQEMLNSSVNTQSNTALRNANLSAGLIIPSFSTTFISSSSPDTPLLTTLSTVYPGSSQHPPLEQAQSFIELNQPQQSYSQTTTASIGRFNHYNYNNYHYYSHSHQQY